MAEQIVLTGMVISAMPIGEYDKRLVILTREKGKITAFAKGARRQNSQFIAGSRPFSFGEFTMYKGKNTYNMVLMNISNFFTEMSSDFDAAYYGFYFMELSDYYCVENVEASDTLKLLYYSFKALTKNSIPNVLIRYIFELKLFVINGEYPEMFCCIKCGKDEEFKFYNSLLNGIICSDCIEVRSDCTTLNPSTIYTMQYVISSAIEKLYSFTVSESVIKELAKILDKFRNTHMDKKCKSLEILEKVL